MSLQTHTRDTRHLSLAPMPWQGWGLGGNTRGGSVFLCLGCLSPKSWCGKCPYHEDRNRSLGTASRVDKQLNSQDLQSAEVGAGLRKTSLAPGTNGRDRQLYYLILAVCGWVGASKTAVAVPLQMFAKQARKFFPADIPPWDSSIWKARSQNFNIKPIIHSVSLTMAAHADLCWEENVCRGDSYHHRTTTMITTKR